MEDSISWKIERNQSTKRKVCKRGNIMTKTILAIIGGVAIVAIIGVCQFGFFAVKAKDVTTQVERATASARVDKSIDDLKDEIDGLDAKARQYRVDARAYELALEREQSEIDRTKSAAKELCAAAKDAGLPKPSESATLTEEQAAVRLTFGAKSLTGREVYSTLERWTTDLKQKEAIVAQKKRTINGMCAVVRKIEEKKGEMSLQLAKMQTRVKELESAKDLAKLNAELAEMEASVAGIAAGKSGEAMNTIREEIDELTATAESYREETQAKDAELSPNDVLEPNDLNTNLDEFWN